ncbi:MAG TPA: hypothetical protein VI584_02260 [Nitrospiria bacterium]|nr:hypothetical protein [Nitrospiria bacterium]
MADTILIIAIDTKLIMENHCKRLKDFIFLAEAIYGTGRLIYFILKYTIYFLLATDKKRGKSPIKRLNDGAYAQRWRNPPSLFYVPFNKIK